MFSHPAPPPTPQQPRDSEVAGAPELDERWSRAAARWRPQVRPASREQWAWLRWAWEQLDGRAPAAPEGTARPGEEDPDLRVLDACGGLLTAFLSAADGRREPEPVAEARTPDGEPLRGAREVEDAARSLSGRAGTTLCFAQLWSLARPEELHEDPWAEAADAASGTGPAADVPGEEAVRRPLFPLSTDDVAWIVSGSMTEQKDRTWRWFAELSG